MRGDFPLKNAFEPTGQNFPEKFCGPAQSMFSSSQRSSQWIV